MCLEARSFLFICKYCLRWQSIFHACHDTTPEVKLNLKQGGPECEKTLLFSITTKLTDLPIGSFLGPSDAATPLKVKEISNAFSLP